MSYQDRFFALLGAMAAAGLVTVHNARGGHACNSSSSHSIVLLPPGQRLPEDQRYDYGWEDFALTTPTSKLHYLASQLGQYAVESMPSLKELMDRFDIDLTSLEGVDHQSMLSFPHSPSSPGLDAAFLTDFATLLLDDQVAILGGNDNSGSSQYRSSDQVVFDLFSTGAWASRKDSVKGQEWWVLYNKDDGTKLRLSLNAAKIYELNKDRTNFSYGSYLNPSNPTKAQTPELVDLKLTDACPFERSCGFCFSGETSYLTLDGPRTFAETVGTKQMVLVSTALRGSEGTRWKTGDFGGRWVEAEIRAFGKQELLKVTLVRRNEKRVIFATPEHRWLTTLPSESGEFRHRRAVTTSELTPGARLAPLFPKRLMRTGAHVTPPSPIGVAHGAVFGDGSLDGRKGSSINLHGEKNAALLPYFGPAQRRTHTTSTGGSYIAVRNLPAFFKRYPDLNESASYLYGWLAGWFAADGDITSPWGSPALDSASRENLEFAVKVCNRLGIGTYGIVEYERVGFGGVLGKMYRLRFVSSCLTPDFFILPEHRTRFENRTGHLLMAAWKVESVERTDRKEEVYCAVVPGYENFTLDGNINVMNCYMGSTVHGQTASLEFVTETLAALARLRVFEVAFGGGEPTLWPHFAEVVRFASQIGVTPNATSKNYAFLRTEEGRKTLSLMGALAFSVNSSKDLHALDAELNNSSLDYYSKNKIAIQSIPALLDEKTLEDIMDYAESNYLRVTMLGYKSSGRGEDFAQAQPLRADDWWLETWKAHPRLSLSVDTVMASQCAPALTAMGVPSWQYHLREGSYSMFIDGVAQTAAASSYAGAGTPLDPAQPLDQQIASAFAAYAPEPSLPRRKARAPRSRTVS